MRNHPNLAILTLKRVYTPINTTIITMRIIQLLAIIQENLLTLIIDLYPLEIQLAQLEFKTIYQSLNTCKMGWSS